LILKNPQGRSLDNGYAATDSELSSDPGRRPVTVG